MGHVQYSTVIPAPLDAVFSYVSDWNNRPEIMPKEDLEINLAASAPPMVKGARYAIEATRFGLHYPLEYVVEDFSPPYQFVERQVAGIFEEWLNSFKFQKHSEDTTVLTNIVNFRLPLGILGTLVDDLFARNDVQKLIRKSQENVKKHFSK